MSIGEFDYDDNFKGESLLVKVIFVIFLVDISLVMMNIVIGLAVTDVKEINKKSSSNWVRWMIREFIVQNFVSTCNYDTE